MFCSRMGNGIPITCTTTYQKWTGQPIHLAGSKNPLPLGMGSVKHINYLFYLCKGKKDMIIAINQSQSQLLEKRKKEAVKISQELGYKKDVWEAIINAQSYYRIDQILKAARHNWDIEYNEYMSKN